ncbi:hypothetical protein TNIN_359031 [Trichonephila inaurata madagascariensis]|uniref:Uncharacterized protein n=1 Tax=Trichonephila inaurata madagascariensis TaxID=2747483 RepID=A0A8X7CSB3_9ARAC|nr:hypothetical protein TNIN_359031 [Trichonephila inaurata madagascariensis]
MLTTLRHSNAQDEDDPTYVEMLRQRTYYENLSHKAVVSDFGSLPYCDNLGCPVHENPHFCPQLNLNLQKRKKDKDVSFPLEKFSKPNLTR